MKKAIAIIILGLLLVGCTTGAQLISEGRIYKGMTKNQLCKVTIGTPVDTAYPSEDPCVGQAFHEYFSHSQQEIWAASGKSVYYIYKDVSTPGKKGNGTLQGWAFSYGDAKDFITPKKIVKKPKKIEPNTTEPSPDDNKVVAASMGSGFFVTRAGHLVTNYHVIKGCNAVKTNILGKEVRTDIVAIDKTNDLAIIKAEMNPSKVFPVSNKDVSLLQDVIVAGFPLGKSVSAIIKTHKGSVTALAGFGDNYSNFQTDATINQGNSGGPIMDLKGNVVGVAVQLIAAEHAQNVFFGVKSSTLKTFANANSINFLPPNNREMSNEDLGIIFSYYLLKLIRYTNRSEVYRKKQI